MSVVKQLFNMIRVLVLTLGVPAGALASQAPFALHLNSKGQIAPFHVANLELESFVREYARVTGQRIEMDLPWNQILKGRVTLSIPSPVEKSKFTEIFHQVLYSNDYSVVNTVDGKAWEMMKTRDARDAPIPVYDGASAPETWRLITVIQKLDFVHAENVARLLRSFMPPNSRIIPIGLSRVAVTDTGVNIRSKQKIIRFLDTPEVGKILERKTEEQNARIIQELRCKASQKNLEKVSIEHLDVNQMNVGEKEGRR